MNRSDVMNEILDIIDNEFGVPIEEEQLLTESEIDSFAFTMLLSEMDLKYGLWTSEEFENLDFPSITPKLIIDKVVEKHGS